MYKPEYTGPIQGWAVNYCRQNLWRVQRSVEWQDLMQDAYLVFMRCRHKYPVLDTPQHFMALYKRAWINEFTNLANRDTELRCEVPHAKHVDGHEVETVGELEGDGFLAVLINEAPREVAMVLNLFLNAPSELLEVALSGWRGRDKRERAGGSKHLCKLLGLDPNLDVLKMVEDHFTAS